jgi:hypothetical protein
MTRTVIASANVSIDGYTAGDGGDVGWLGPHVDALAPVHEGLWRGADTAIVGRINFEGFQAYWPVVAADEDADPRSRHRVLDGRRREGRRLPHARDHDVAELPRRA